MNSNSESNIDLLHKEYLKQTSSVYCLCNVLVFCFKLYIFSFFPGFMFCVYIFSVNNKAGQK